MTKISVIGSGYVGTTTAAILANAGHEVFALDIDKRKVDSINSGKSPFFEAGLDNLLRSAIDKKTLRATTNYSEAIPGARVIFSCVGTPDNPDGSSNLNYIYSSAQEAAKYIDQGVVFVQKSTVPVGTGEKVARIFKNKKVGYVSNPEFLRESTAVLDTILFDRVVVGGDNKNTKPVIDLYKDIENNSKKISELSGILIDTKEIEENRGLYIETTLQSAELTKVTANAFLATKISFANSIAKLADATGADINEVMDIVGADKRIGRAFLNAGRGYGGGCFPKDVTGLISSAHEYGVDISLMDSVSSVNASMPGYVANKLAAEYRGDLYGKSVAILGLAFKSGTSDARRSPAVAIANTLARKGVHVNAYDPQAIEEASQDLVRSVEICDSVNQAANGVDAAIVATHWPEFDNIDFDKLLASMNGNVFVDAMNSFDRKKLSDTGFKYVGIGR